MTYINNQTPDPDTLDPKQTQVLSLCFSADGWALAVGHEGALTVWSTEDGTRLVCTTSDTHEDNAHPEETPSPTTRAPAIGRAASTDGGGGSAESEPLSPSSRRPAAGTLDVIAGGARALSWESEGYRLLSVGSAVGGGEGTTGQGIVAFDFLRRARSNLSSSLLSLQVRDYQTIRPFRKAALPTVAIESQRTRNTGSSSPKFRKTAGPATPLCAKSFAAIRTARWSSDGCDVVLCSSTCRSGGSTARDIAHDAQSLQMKREKE